jgi:two-component system cell cycle sensor histidine kinase/response regulator CckA
VRIRTGPAEGAWLEWLVEPLEDGLLVVSVPMSDGEAELERIRRAERLGALGLLAGGVAHDVNNHLTVIRSLASVLESASLPAELADDARGIGLAADRAGDLIRRLLTYGRPQEQEVRVDPAVVVSGVLELVRRLIPASVRVMVLAAPGQGMVSMDRSALEQVVMNLVLNARDAIVGPGAIEVRVERTLVEHLPQTLAGGTVPPGTYLLLSVRDTGSGIHESEIKKLADPFYTAHKPGGTGLGLTTVQGLLRSRGGYLVVESVLGEGSTFSVLLPWASSDAAGP